MIEVTFNDEFLEHEQKYIAFLRNYSMTTCHTHSEIFMIGLEISTEQKLYDFLVEELQK